MNTFLKYWKYLRGKFYFLLSLFIYPYQNKDNKRKVKTSESKNARKNENKELKKWRH